MAAIDNDMNEEDRLTALFENLKNKARLTNFPRNILLIGSPSAGKSSFVNLLSAVFRGEYLEIAQPGSCGIGEQDSVTNHIMQYPQLGLTDAEVQEFKRRYDFNEDFVLPNIIDIPGISVKDGNDEDVGNRNRKYIDTILRYVIEGIIPSETEISSFMSCGDLLTNLRGNQDLRVDRVIFVISISQDVDERMLRNALDILSGSKGQHRVIPYTIVYTHVDRIGDGTNVKRETAEERKNISAGILKLANNRQLNTHDIINYSDDTDKIDENGVAAYETDIGKHIQAVKALIKCVVKRELGRGSAVTTRETTINNAVHLLNPLWIHKVPIMLVLLAVCVVFCAKMYGFPRDTITKATKHLKEFFYAFVETFMNLT